MHNMAVVHRLTSCTLISTLQECRRVGMSCQVTTRVDDITSISAKLVSQSTQCGLAELQFWSSQKPEKPVYKAIIVHMPPLWTPKMYLAAIFISVQYKPNIFIMEIESPLNMGQEIIAINDLSTSYFGLQDKQEFKIVLGLGWFSILGGNM